MTSESSFNSVAPEAPADTNSNPVPAELTFTNLFAAPVKLAGVSVNETKVELIVGLLFKLL